MPCTTENHAELLATLMALLLLVTAAHARGLRQWWQFNALDVAGTNGQWPSAQQQQPVVYYTPAAAGTTFQMPQLTQTTTTTSQSQAQAATTVIDMTQQASTHSIPQGGSSPQPKDDQTPDAGIQVAGDVINDSVLQQVLGLHNNYRARHQVGPLTWSVELQSSAQRWADNCAFVHSQTGENLGLNFPDFPSVVVAWYDEITQYSYQARQFGEATGHATQVLWKASTRLGCGYNMGCKLYVCHYDPPGNVIGQFQSNVFPPLSH